jgi:hypothetical protein
LHKPHESMVVNKNAIDSIIEVFIILIAILLKFLTCMIICHKNTTKPHKKATLNRN